MVLTPSFYFNKPHTILTQTRLTPQNIPTALALYVRAVSLFMWFDRGEKRDSEDIPLINTLSHDGKQAATAEVEEVGGPGGGMMVLGDGCGPLLMELELSSNAGSDVTASLPTSHPPPPTHTAGHTACIRFNTPPMWGQMSLLPFPPPPPLPPPPHAPHTQATQLVSACFSNAALCLLKTKRFPEAVYACK